MTNTKNYSNQTKKFLIKITVLVCVTIFKSYVFSSENSLKLLC